MKKEVIIPIRLDEEFITNMKSGNNHSSDYYQKIIIDYLDRREIMGKVDDYILEFNNLTADDIEAMNVYQIEQLMEKLRFVDNQLSRNLNSVKNEDTIEHCVKKCLTKKRVRHFLLKYLKRSSAYG